MESPPPFEHCWALLSYDGDAARLVAELKYRNHRDALSTVGRAMAVFVRRSETPVSTLTWAPTSSVRRRRRGYDQAALLARAVARPSGLPAIPMLRRRPGAPQTGADRAHRLLGPSFEPTRAVEGHVVVIDDVCTTGATLHAAAVALRQAGATRVSGLVLAATA